MSRTRRWMLAGAAAVAAGALVAAGLGLAAREARTRILAALGPRVAIGAVALGYPGVTLRDVRIAAAPGAWPAAEEFHAARVDIDIGIASLWAFRHGQPLQVDDIHVEDGALVLLRTHGHLDLLPALRGAGGAAPTPQASLVLRHIRFEDMAVDLVDATLPGAPRVHFSAVKGHVDDLALPALDQPVALALEGTIKGVEHDGRASLDGRFTPARHDVDLSVRLAQADMVALQPWLRHLGERSIRHGRMDLALAVHVRDRALHAPGSVTLTGLEFGDAGGGVLAGMERRAVLAALRRDGRVDLKFSVDGRTDDPRFALDERLGARIAGGLGDAVGNGMRSAVQSVGSLFGKGH